MHDMHNEEDLLYSFQILRPCLVLWLADWTGDVCWIAAARLSCCLSSSGRMTDSPREDPTAG